MHWESATVYQLHSWLMLEHLPQLPAQLRVQEELKVFEMQNYSVSHFFGLNATINIMLTLMHLHYWGENTAGKAFKNISCKAFMTFTGLSGINLEKQKDICTHCYISE